MADTDEVNYSFLPWLRRGIIGLADQQSISVNQSLRIPLQVHATGEGLSPAVIDQMVSLYGPGNITGINSRAIVRTIPRSGVRNFEANFLCAIEFYDEDFPWRYSPAIPLNEKLTPWLWLVVLKDDEFLRHTMGEGLLPAVEVFSTAMSKAFPETDSTWAWAHTHLNFTVEGTTIAEKRSFVESKLDNNPNLGCSRIICPRRLQPSTHYTCFLIPAFEKGRLAGLGKSDEEINAIPNAEISWSLTSDARLFPIFYEWHFVTQSKGDFESLARLLSPLNSASAAALEEAELTINIRKPGWGLSYNGSNPVLALQSALLPVKKEQASLLSSSEDAQDITFTNDLSSLLNLGVVSEGADIAGNSPNPFYEGSNALDDPFIVPPLYGSFYRENSMNQGITSGKSTVSRGTNDWYNQLNLNIPYRIAAGRGTEVIQLNQESYMNRAWDQMSLLFDEHRLAKRYKYSLEISESFYNKRILPILSGAADLDETQKANKSFQAISFMAPMHKGLIVENKSFKEVLKSKPATSSYSASFSKLKRKGGPVARRLARVNIAAPEFQMVDIVTTKPQRQYLAEAIQMSLDLLENVTLIFMRKDKDQTLRNEGFGGIEQCKTALQNLVEVVKKKVKPPVSIFSDIKLFEVLRQQTQPLKTINQRFNAQIKTTQPVVLETETTQVSLDEPEFNDPMYRPLADRSTDYILPGLSAIPINTVALLKTNQAFIESFMVGINHEIAREYLWRELPAPLNSTSFRQFWDVRNNPKAKDNPEFFKDIKAIKSWGSNLIGFNAPNSKVAEKMVVLIRGDLLHKYPNTEIYLHKAVWEDGNAKPRIPATAIGDQSIRRSLFSAQINPDFQFVGFDLDPDEAIGLNSTDPGWYVVFKERAGDIHFGLDLDASNNNPSWAALPEISENNCININSDSFKQLPGFPGQAGIRSDRLGKMLYQRPFVLFVHASRLVPTT